MCLRVQVLWAVCVYIEAVSVLPQLRMMQNAKARAPGCMPATPLETFSKALSKCLRLKRV